ncbi:hypothetical protein HDIA_1833 [Hartmannibacter diazotrophicus]|uniref:DUF58 domain-containing protein n=1 Tax=Hartmannibacter diazotrophicus TaxID=1482074 RepID=A0A2C9D4Y8_9HYPH|nr:DUF58 domain-containing protein [Hartmannibacter diazotrophicus]SON55374.1 hypothetical protein HDIA_1833 [Hartmannibacter diazotrophicus]
MVTSALRAPGIRLTAEELLELRQTGARTGRHRPASGRTGIVPAKPPGSGIDLREIRAFAEGDDARRIDPSTTARTGQIHVRSFHEDRDDTTILVADFRPPMHWGTGEALRSVRAARALARRGWEAAERSASIGALAVNSHGSATVPAGQGFRQMSAIAEMLAAQHERALMAPGDGPSLEEVLARLAQMAPAGSEVLIATGPDGIAPSDEAALARLARRRRVTVLLPLDPVEIAPPSSALPIRSDGRTRLARMKPIEIRELAGRLKTLNVSLETLADDAG